MTKLVLEVLTKLLVNVLHDWVKAHVYPKAKKLLPSLANSVSKLIGKRPTKKISEKTEEATLSD